MESGCHDFFKWISSWLLELIHAGGEIVALFGRCTAAFIEIFKFKADTCESHGSSQSHFVFGQLVGLYNDNKDPFLEASGLCIQVKQMVNLM